MHSSEDPLMLQKFYLCTQKGDSTQYLLLHLVCMHFSSMTSKVVRHEEKLGNMIWEEILIIYMYIF